MESFGEIERKTVVELRSFLQRNGVPHSNVPRADGSFGNARKSDLLHRATQVRRDYDLYVLPYTRGADGQAAAPPQPTTPERAYDPAENPFQQTSPSALAAVKAVAASPNASPEAALATMQRVKASAAHSHNDMHNPRTAASTPARPANGTAKAVSTARARANADGPDKITRVNSPAASTPAGSKTAVKNRRRSVGWLDPALVASIRKQNAIPKQPSNAFSSASTAPAPPSPPGPARATALALADTPALDVTPVDDTQPPPAAAGYNSASSGDELVNTDVDTDRESAPALSESETLLFTDDEDDDYGRRGHDHFEGMRVTELKAWLASQKVRFYARAKRAELLSLCRGHNTHLEVVKTDSRPPPLSPKPAAGAASGLGWDSSNLNQTPAPSSHKTQASVAAAITTTDGDDDDEIAVVPSSDAGKMRRGRPRKRMSSTRVPADLDDDVVADEPIDLITPAPTPGCCKIAPEPEAKAEPVLDPARQSEAMANLQHAQQPRKWTATAAPASPPPPKSAGLRTRRSQAVTAAIARLPSEAPTPVVGRHTAGASTPAPRKGQSHCIDKSRFRIPRFPLPVITARAVLNSVALVLAALVMVSVVNVWRFSQRPFCLNDAGTRKSCHLLVQMPPLALKLGMLT
jgi:hypothetical protein